MASTPRVRICHMPNEVLVSIFASLPVADLARCAGVCDRWHGLVTRFAKLWKGKSYESNRSPRECAETRAVLHALPPLREVVIESTDGFQLRITYPRVIISVKYISVMDDCPRLSCEDLSTRLDIAGDILSHRSTVDFDRLRQLRILRISTLNTWAPRDYTADYAVRASLSLCPSLRQLSVAADSLSADYLDAAEGLGRLQSLEIECPGLQKLSFLRHCSEGLRELQLVECTGIPTPELSELRQLQNLRKLRLSDCPVEEGDLAANFGGLAELESLVLKCVPAIGDLSALGQCGHLQKLCIMCAPMLEPMMPAQLASLRLHELRPPAPPRSSSLRAVGIMVTADTLPDALSRLAELRLSGECLAYLGPLCACSQLKHVCCEFAHEPTKPEQLNVRLDITLTGSPQN